VRKIFAPDPIPRKFQRFPKEMAFRPSQVRASAAEAALMIPSAAQLKQHYTRLQLPVLIIAGEEDHYIQSQQSMELHRTVSNSTLRIIAGTGHMVHQTATRQVASWICDVSAQNTSNEDASEVSAQTTPKL
jgi:pimeloyl-ACP methyl ester carboxylesterase